MSAFTIFISIYLLGSILCSLYIVVSHLRATWTYFRRLYTAKEVNISEIKTYFGWKFHEDPWNSDDWSEVILMSTMMTIMYTMIAFVAWPGLSLVLLNKSIENARKRVHQDS